MNIDCWKCVHVGIVCLLCCIFKSILSLSYFCKETWNGVQFFEYRPHCAASSTGLSGSVQYVCRLCSSISITETTVRGALKQWATAGNTAPAELIKRCRVGKPDEDHGSDFFFFFLLKRHNIKVWNYNKNYNKIVLTINNLLLHLKIYFVMYRRFMQ